MAIDEHRRTEIRAWATEHQPSTRAGRGPGMVLELLAEVDRLLGELDLADEALAHCIRVAAVQPFPREFLASGHQTRHQAPPTR